MANRTRALISGDRSVRLWPNMAKFMYIFRGGAFVTPGLSPTEMQRHMEKWYAWADELAKQGRHTGGNPLHNGGRTIQGHERLVTDGPYAESKDLVTGSLVIEAASLDEATELALACPVFELGGSLEVRPVLGQEAGGG
jgi:hypothetical protein